METQRVGDITIPLEAYPHVPCWYTLLQVIEAMEKAQIDFLGRKSLPRVVLVFDLDSSVHGMVRRRDILRGLEPGFSTRKRLDYHQSHFDVRIDPNLTELAYDRLAKGVMERAKQPVSDVMIPFEETVDYTDHIMTVVAKMVQHDLSLIPVLKDKKVVGVVRSVDVFHVVTRTLLEGQGTEE